MYSSGLAPPSPSSQRRDRDFPASVVRRVFLVAIQRDPPGCDLSFDGFQLSNDALALVTSAGGDLIHRFLLFAALRSFLPGVVRL